MKPTDFKTLIDTISNLIDKRAETTEVRIKLHVTEVVSGAINSAEERIKTELRGEILAARAEAKADHLHLLGKLDKFMRITNQRWENLETATNTPNPHKN